MSAPTPAGFKPRTTWQAMKGWGQNSPPSVKELSYKKPVKVRRENGLMGVMRDGYIFPAERDKRVRYFNFLFLRLLDGKAYKLKEPFKEPIRSALAKRLLENGVNLGVRVYKLDGADYIYFKTKRALKGE